MNVELERLAVECESERKRNKSGKQSPERGLQATLKSLKYSERHGEPLNDLSRELIGLGLHFTKHFGYKVGKMESR